MVNAWWVPDRARLPFGDLQNGCAKVKGKVVMQFGAGPAREKYGPLQDLFWSRFG